MLIAGLSRDELLSIARKDNSVSALTTVLDTLEADPGVVWIVRDRCRGGMNYRVEFQVREGADLKTVREADLVHNENGWVIQ